MLNKEGKPAWIDKIRERDLLKWNCLIYVEGLHTVEEILFLFFVKPFQNSTEWI